jgi:hypothetical protein
MTTRSYPCVAGAFVQPLLQWKGNKYYIFWVCVCSLRYPACKAHAPYCHSLAVRLYHIFRHYLINGTIFVKKSLASITFVWNIFHSKKKWARYHMRIFVFMYKYPLFYYYLNETCVFLTNYRKIFKYQISWKSIQCEPSCSVWTGGRTDKTRVIVTFRNFANAPKTPLCLKTAKGKFKKEQDSDSVGDAGNIIIIIIIIIRKLSLVQLHLLY